MCIRDRAVLELRKTKLGLDHPDTIASMIKVGNLLLEVDAERASELLLSAYSSQKSKTPDEWSTFDVQSLFGKALLLQKKYKEAKRHLSEAFSGLKTNVKDMPKSLRSKRLNDTIDRLIELAKATEDDEDLKKWTKEKEWLESELDTAEGAPSQ